MEGPVNASISSIIKNDHNGTVVAVIVPMPEQSSYIHKLPIELLVKVFDFLSLKDLHAVYQTSKLWLEVAFYCYQRNYSATRTSDYDTTNLYRYHVSNEDSCYQYEHHRDIMLNAFISKIQKYVFEELSDKKFQYFLELQSKFHMLRILEFHQADFTNIEIESMKEVLGKVEWLQLTWYTVGKYSYFVSEY